MNSLRNLKLPDNLSVIKKSTFQYCSALTELSIPSSVEFIYAEAFAGCGSLQTVSSYAINPPYLYESAFSNYNIPLYVPEESFLDYKSAQGWKNFTEIKTLSGVEPDVKKCATPKISYADKKLTFTCDTEGATCQYTITDSDIKTDFANEVSLSATYEISVYAMKTGLEDSDVATATLVWTEAIFTETTPSSDTPTSAKAIRECIPALISANSENIIVKSEANGQTVAVYSVDGQLLGNATVSNGQAKVPTTLQNGNVAVVKIGNKAVKIMIR